MALPVNKYNGIFDKLCDSGHPVALMLMLR